MIIFYILFVFIFIAGSALVLYLSQIHQNPKTFHKSTPAEYNIPFQEVFFEAQNDCKLYGWWIPSQNESSKSVPALILIHGWGRNLESMLPYIKELHPCGFNLLAFDTRNHGNSDSDKHSSMFKFAQDIDSAITYIEKRTDVDPNRIGIIGISMGGAASFYAANCNARIKNVVTIGALAHPVDILKLQLKRMHIPNFPMVWMIVKFIEYQIRISIEQIAPVNNVAISSAKFLMIHGEKDAVVPVEQGEKLRNAGNSENTHLWIVPEKGHSNCSEHPEFWQRIKSFMQQSFSE